MVSRKELYPARKKSRSLAGETLLRNPVSASNDVLRGKGTVSSCADDYSKFRGRSQVATSANGAGSMFRTLRGDNFFENRIEIFADAPFRVVRLEFAQVRDIANMIALACFFHVLPI